MTTETTTPETATTERDGFSRTPPLEDAIAYALEALRRQQERAMADTERADDYWT
jgi:hypothetical protein